MECKEWVHLNIRNKVQDINEKITNITSYQCGTDVQYSIETDQYAFRCRTGQDFRVVYNAHLSQAANTVASSPGSLGGGEKRAW